MTQFVKTDEFEDVRASLLLLQGALKNTRSDGAYWKWAVFSAHSALQGSCVCFLTRSDGGGAFTKEVEEQLIRYHDQRSQKAINEKRAVPFILKEESPPNCRVAPLGDLLKKLPEPYRTITKNDISKCPDDKSTRLSCLIQLRNEFAHFAPQSWSIEKSLLEQVILASVQLTSEICMSSKFANRNRFNTEVEVAGLLCAISSDLERRQEG